MKILVVEDEPAMLNSILETLRRERYVVETASNMADALDKIATHDYSCILLDLGLPDGSGLSILRELKKSGKNDGVIVISARNSLDHKIEGLELGADDYLTKPFHLAELNARVKAVLRRRSFDGRNTLRLGNLEVNFQEHSVLVGERQVMLNRKEFDILAYFIENKNRLVSKSSIAARVWGDHTDDSDNFEFIYSQIKNLRKKLKEHGAEVEIRAVYGIGYKLETEQ